MIQQFYKPGVWNLRDVLKGVKNGSWPLASRGVFGGGYETSALNVNTLEYISIQILANVIDFGDL